MYPKYLEELIRVCKEDLKIEKISIITNGSLVKRNFFERYGKYDTAYRLVEDYPYAVDLLRNGVRIDFMNCVTVEHSIGGVSTGKIHPAVIKDIEHMREVLKADPHGLSKQTVKYLNSIK